MVNLLGDTVDLHIDNYKFSIDFGCGTERLNFVSHAHSDHTNMARSSKEIVASVETGALVETRYGIKPNVASVPEGVSLLDAGHVLGAKQILCKDDDTKMVYTGDYLMQDSKVAPKIRIEHADIAIMDSTYPSPKIKFEERDEVIDAIKAFVDSKTKIGHVLFEAHALGKAQELIYIMNSIGIMPAVSSKIARVSEKYKELGVNLEFAEYVQGSSAYDVYITDASSTRAIKSDVSNNTAYRLFTAVATGFAKIFKFGTDVQFPLSDHADFWQALEYLERCKPGKTYVVGSSAQTMATFLSEYGYDAHALENEHVMYSMPRLQLGTLQNKL